MGRNDQRLAEIEWFPGLPDGTKNTNLGKFWRDLQCKMLVYLWPFGIHILWSFGIFLLIDVCCTKKNLAALMVACFQQNHR
jgi:hypothetical protein